METIDRALIWFFERVARKDAAYIDKLKHEPGFLINQERWRFTLPALYCFLQKQDEVFREADYGRFRRALFSSPINQTVKSCGAEVIIEKNRAKVDRSTYALVWRQERQGLPLDMRSLPTGLQAGVSPTGTAGKQSGSSGTS